MKFCFAIMFSHVSHRSYPSRRRACSWLVKFEHLLFCLVLSYFFMAFLKWIELMAACNFLSIECFVVLFNIFFAARQLSSLCSSCWLMMFPGGKASPAVTTITDSWDGLIWPSSLSTEGFCFIAAISASNDWILEFNLLAGIEKVWYPGILVTSQFQI